MEAAVNAIASSVRLVVPEAILVLGACATFLFGPFVSNPKTTGGDVRAFWARFSLVTLALAYIASLWFGNPAVANLAASPFRLDAVAAFVRPLVFAAGALLILLSIEQWVENVAAENAGCFLLVLAGCNFTAAANDLVGLFLALELVSVPTYILLYLGNRGVLSQEATIKYFLLSIFSSALFLFGASYLFGTVGSTNLEVIRASLVAASGPSMPTVLLLAFATIIAGLGFRITAVPFHFYAPDVFQGTQTSLAAMLAYLPKIVGFVALLRLVGSWLPINNLAEAAPSVASQTVVLLWTLAILTMFLGNVLAPLQDNLKRILAYSSVAHAGYMLVGLAASRSGSTEIAGSSALLFYLAVYGAMTVGFFAFLIHLDSKGGIETVDDIAGLGKTHPVAAAVAAIFLFSLIGLPPTAGFFGKLFILQAAWGQGTYAFKLLTVIMMVNAAIGGWYYLRLVGAMYLSPGKAETRPAGSMPGAVCMAICAVATVGLFSAPNILWKLVAQATI